MKDPLNTFAELRTSKTHPIKLRCSVDGEAHSVRRTSAARGGVDWPFKDLSCRIKENKQRGGC